MGEIIRPTWDNPLRPYHAFISMARSRVPNSRASCLRRYHEMNSCWCGPGEMRLDIGTERRCRLTLFDRPMPQGKLQAVPEYTRPSELRLTCSPLSVFGGCDRELPADFASEPRFCTEGRPLFVWSALRRLVSSAMTTRFHPSGAPLWRNYGLRDVCSVRILHT